MNKNFAFGKIEIEIYNAIIEQHKNIKIRKTHLNINDINIIMQSMLDNHPDVFYVNEWDVFWSNDEIVVCPKYIGTKKEISVLKTECDKQIEIILSRTNGMSLKESIKRIHDILIRNITYSENDNYTHHTIIGPIIERKAVCDGFSRLYKYLLNKLNIDCIVVRGRGFNGTLVDSESHLWNMINLYGKWYHIDVTYDATLSLNDYIRYDYFLVDDATIRIDHYYNHRDTPKANDMSEYLYSNKQIAHNKYQLLDCFLEKVQKKESDFIVMIGKYWQIEDIEKTINSCLFDLSDKIDDNYNFSLNINQARRIVHVRCN